MDFIDLQKKAVAIKTKYNKLEIKKFGKKWSTEQQVAGLVVDVGELVELSMAKSGVKDIDNVDQKIAHELADCLFSIIVIAEKYDVNLEKSFIDLISNLNQRIDKNLV